MYICDFVEVIKMCKSKLYKLYRDPKRKFGDEIFKTFLASWLEMMMNFLLFLLNHSLMMVIGALQGSIATKF
jgi:hypothetical protein